MMDFEIEKFLKLVPDRKAEVDDQIFDMLMSLVEFETFKQLILDYKTSNEEAEALRVLTIKSNKIPETKKVKGSENIFATQNNPVFGKDKDSLASLKKNAPMARKSPVKDKTEDQILVPDLILTVKPLKKG